MDHAFPSRVIKRPRKAHQCFGCLLWMQPGVPHVRGSGIFDGEFAEWRWCDLCQGDNDRHWQSCDDGWGKGQLIELRVEDASNIFGRWSADWSEIIDGIVRLRPDLYVGTTKPTQE